MVFCDLRAGWVWGCDDGWDEKAGMVEEVAGKFGEEEVVEEARGIWQRNECGIAGLARGRGHGGVAANAVSYGGGGISHPGYVELKGVFVRLVGDSNEQVLIEIGVNTTVEFEMPPDGEKIRRIDGVELVAEGGAGGSARIARGHGGGRG